MSLNEFARDGARFKTKFEAERELDPKVEKEFRDSLSHGLDKKDIDKIMGFVKGVREDIIPFLTHSWDGTDPKFPMDKAHLIFEFNRKKHAINYKGKTPTLARRDNGIIGIRMRINEWEPLGNVQKGFFSFPELTATKIEVSQNLIGMEGAFSSEIVDGKQVINYVILYGLDKDTRYSLEDGKWVKGTYNNYPGLAQKFEHHVLKNGLGSFAKLYRS